MEILILAPGKMKEKYLEEGVREYLSRLSHFVKVNLITADVPSGKKGIGALEGEADWMLKQLKTSDLVLLLDEKGSDFSSEGFSILLQEKMNLGVKRMVLLIGGAYGFAPVIREKGWQMIRLSSMTFTHQMVRLFLVEQLYRAFTLLNGIPYHNK